MEGGKNRNCLKIMLTRRSTPTWSRGEPMCLLYIVIQPTAEGILRQYQGLPEMLFKYQEATEPSIMATSSWVSTLSISNKITK